ncbi:MAG: hypothetical protein ABEJ35_04340 [Halobacteriaceae archaeon]
MPEIPSPFGGTDDDLFESYDAFTPATEPAPGQFLEGHAVLDGRDHAAFHRLTRALFEERTVYDMTFDYNLARLNLDTRHQSAGYRYGIERSDAAAALDEPGIDRVLRAEFTPTTPFCPQTHTLTIGSFRAWNGLADRHEYDLVRVRAAPMHHQSAAINEELGALEATYLETGEVAVESADSQTVGATALEQATEQDRPTRGSGDALF